MSTAALSFTGLSSFSTDFQSILSREVAIAQLPLKALQNQQSDILQKKQLLVGLNAAVADVGSSISALGQLGAGKALSASSSDTSKVSVVNSSATTPATYTISNITSVAAAASETSVTGYASATTPVATDGNVTVVVGGKSYPIGLDSTHNNLAGLRDAINKLGVGVTASVLTTGTGATPNYLTVTAVATGQTTLQVNDTPKVGSSTGNLLTAANQGSNAVFQLNGVNVTHTTNTINDVVSGITFTILGKTSGTGTVNLSLSTDRSQISSALSDFATKYNAVVDQVNSQVGPAAGLLSGDFLISEVERDLRQTTGFQGANSIRGIANLGISLDATGKITFDSKAVDSLTDTQLSDAFTFLGSSTTGFGSLASKFTQLSDPASGLIQSQSQGYDVSTQRLNDRVSKLQTQISNITTSVTARLQQADALLAGLESQQKILAASVTSVDFALYGKNFGSSSG